MTERTPLRILQVMAGSAHGGAEMAFVDTCLAFQEFGQEIVVATRANDHRVPRLKEAGIPVHELSFGGAFDFQTARKLSEICKEFQPHIVQTWMSRAAQKMPAWKPSMGISRYYNVARLGGYYKLKYFKHSDFFTTITPDIRAHLIRGGIDGERVRHVNNFAETEAAPEPIDRIAEGLPKDAVLLLGLGRLHEAKAFDTLIDVVADLPEQYHLWIAGEGPDREKLEAQIADRGVQGRVRLLGWRTDRAALLQACDICCFTSRYEPFGTVFVQAWSQHTPVIVSDADGPRQFVRDGEDGLITPRDDKEALTMAIVKLSSDFALQKTCIENGYKRYENEFSKPRTIAAYLDYFHEIINENQSLSLA